MRKRRLVRRRQFVERRSGRHRCRHTGAGERRWRLLGHRRGRVLTMATGAPAFYPWVIDDAPETGEGFESAVATPSPPRWATTPTRWCGSGPLRRGDPARREELRHEPPAVHDRAEREENIDFSLPYYTSNQAIVGLEGSAAEGATTIADLKAVKFGAQAGTTSLASSPTSSSRRRSRSSTTTSRRQGRARSQPDRRRGVRPAHGGVRVGVEIEGSTVIGSSRATPAVDRCSASCSRRTAP